MESGRPEVTAEGVPLMTGDVAVKITNSEDLVLECTENFEAPPVLLPELGLEETGVDEKIDPCILPVHQPEKDIDIEKPGTSLQSVKLSILERKRRAAKIRQVLSRNSKMLRVQRWQKSVSTSGVNSETEDIDEPQRKRTRSDTGAAPVLELSSYSAEEVEERRERCMRPPVLRKQSSSASSGTNNSEPVEDPDEEVEQGTNSDMGSGSQQMRKTSELGEEEEEEGQVIFSEEVLEEEEDEREPQGSEHEGSSVTSMMRMTRSRAEVEEDSSVSEARVEKADTKSDGSIGELPVKEIKKKAESALLEPSYAKKITDFDSVQKMRKNYMKNLPRGRGRRSIMKKFWRPGKSAKPGHWCGVVNAITIDNSFFQTGDVVSVRSQDDQIYFLQLQLIMMDRREYEGYGKMFWLTPKPGFTGPRFPFHPRNYEIRRDVPPLMASLDTVAHVAHCPLDYFDGHTSYWKPEAGTVYQSYGDSLVKWIPFRDKKADVPHEAVNEADETETNFETRDDDANNEEVESVKEVNVV